MSLGKKAQDIDNGLQKNVFGNKKWKKLRPRRELFKLKKFKELAMPQEISVKGRYRDYCNMENGSRKL